MKQYVLYEVRNSLGNIFAIIFGIFFPTMMTVFLYYAIGAKMPDVTKDAFAVQIFVTNLQMSPLALVFIGFSALFSQEIEQDVTTRMTLFGYTETKQMKAKLIAQIAVLIFSLVIYCMVVIPSLRIPAPSIYGLLVFVASIIVLTVCFYLLAYGISLLAKKFSITYGITMSLYFLIMIFSGMMGISSDQLPKAMRLFSNLLPTTHIVSDIPQLWNSNSYNLAALVQSFLFFLAISLLVVGFAITKNKRKLR